MAHSSSAMPQLEGRSEMLGSTTSSKVDMKPQKAFSCTNHEQKPFTSDTRKYTVYLLWLLFSILGNSILHESPAQPQDLCQEDGVGVHVGSEAVQHLKYSGVEVNHGRARLQQESVRWRRGGTTNAFGSPRSTTVHQI